jgi:hypothetical protein
MTDTGFTRTALTLDGDERFVSLRRPLEVSGLGMNLMILAPGQRGRIHDHERQEEVYLVWEGALTLLVEGVPHDLGRVHTSSASTKSWSPTSKSHIPTPPMTLSKSPLTDRPWCFAILWSLRWRLARAWLNPANLRCAPS